MDLQDERLHLEVGLAAGDETTRIPLGCALQLIGEWSIATAHLEIGITAARAAGNARLEVEGLVALGVCQRLLGRTDDATLTFQSAIDRATAAFGRADPWIARARWELGVLTADEAQLARAAELWVACAQPAWGLRVGAYLAHVRGQSASLMYRQAIAALDHAIGETNPLLIEVLVEAAPSFAPADARGLLQRAVTLAQTTTGPASQRTLDTVWALVSYTKDPSYLDGVRDSVRGDARAEAAVVYMRALLDAEAAVGFVETSQLLPPDASTLTGAAAAHEVSTARLPSAATTLDLRDEPDAERLRVLLAEASPHELCVIAGFAELEYPEQATNARAILDVLAARPLPLRGLAILQQPTTRTDLPVIAGCDHAEARVFAQLPDLERLQLAGIDLVHSIAHPVLRQLALDDRPICTAGSWDLPALHALAWTLPFDSEFERIDPLWDQKLPALRELSISASFYDAEDALDREPVCARIATLHRLAIPASFLGDDPHARLLEAAALLAHLAVLRVTDLDAADPRIARLRRELPNLML